MANEIKFEINKDLFEVIKAVYRIKDTYITFRLHKKGLLVWELDDSKVSLVYSFLNKKVFDEYDIENNTEITVDIGILMKMLKIIGIPCEISCNERSITLISNGNEISIPTADISVNKIGKFNFKFPARFSIDNNKLSKILNNVNDDEIKIVSKDKKIYGIVKSDMFSLNSEIGVLLNDSKVNSNYNMDYLKEILKTFGKEIIHCKGGEDTPMFLSNGKITCLLAPRISD